jgi:demethoxyubiquinone hydroxylase (CLK1/Coq7/Cat5 family)
MSSITITYLYSLLSEKLGKENAENLTSYIENKIEKDIEQQTRHLATKEDLERGFKEQSRWMLGIFITLTIMILGLYAAILLKK